MAAILTSCDWYFKTFCTVVFAPHHFCLDCTGPLLAEGATYFRNALCLLDRQERQLDSEEVDGLLGRSVADTMLDMNSGIPGLGGSGESVRANSGTVALGLIGRGTVKHMAIRHSPVLANHWKDPGIVPCTDKMVDDLLLHGLSCGCVFLFIAIIFWRSNSLEVLRLPAVT